MRTVTGKGRDLLPMFQGDLRFGTLLTEPDAKWAVFADEQNPIGFADFGGNDNLDIDVQIDHSLINNVYMLMVHDLVSAVGDLNVKLRVLQETRVIHPVKGIMVVPSESKRYGHTISGPDIEKLKMYGERIVAVNIDAGDVPTDGSISALYLCFTRWRDWPGDVEIGNWDEMPLL